jgi:hypothetical protein
LNANKSPVMTALPSSIVIFRFVIRHITASVTTAYRH